MPLLHRQMLEVLGIKQADKLVPLEEDQKPTDPVTENMNLLVGKPLKAFAYQDHEAHIQVHQSAMQDPLIQQMVGQNPQAQQIMGSMQAHLAEHIGFAYRNKIELSLGVALPNPEDELPEEMEKQISRLMAEAAPKVLKESKDLVAQQQAQEQAQKNAEDPVIQIQMQELQIKQQELQVKQQEVQIKQQEMQLKTEKVKNDAAARTEELAIRKSDVETRAQLESVKIGAKAASEQRESEARQQLEGIRIGSDMAIRNRQLDQDKETPPKGE
jgi:paraquat-inducible protein B